MSFSNRLLAEVFNCRPRLWNLSIRFCASGFNYANWPDKTEWSHLELLEALRSVGSNEEPLYPKGIHIDPNLSSSDASDIAVYTAAKRYGVAAAIGLIEKYPDTFLFRDPPVHMGSKTDKNTTYLKSSIETDDAETFYRGYKLIINTGKSVSSRILFRMTERACLFNSQGDKRIDTQIDRNSMKVTSFGDVILEDFNKEPNKYVNEGYFFGLLWTLRLECAKKFFEENKTFKGDLYSDVYYLYALKNFPEWYKSPQLISVQCGAVIDLYMRKQIIPSDDVMNQLLRMMWYQGQQAFIDFLDELNNLEIPLSFESFRFIHSTIGQPDPELALHYVKRFVKELLNSENTNLQISSDLEGNKEYLLQASDMLANKNMRNFLYAFVQGLTRLNAWDSLGFFTTGCILDNLLKLETTEENFRNTLVFLSRSNIPPNVTSTMLDKIIRAMERCTLNDFIENFKLLMIIYKEKMEYDTFLLMAECMNEILMRDYMDVSVADAVAAIKFLNSLSEVPQGRRITNRMSDAYVILNLIAKDYTSLMNILKKGSPRVRNVRKYEKIVQKLLERFEDFFEVQDIIMTYQRYFALHSMIMHQTGQDSNL